MIRWIVKLKLKSSHWGFLTDSQRVTWTAFRILAMQCFPRIFHFEGLNKFALKYPIILVGPATHGKQNIKLCQGKLSSSPTSIFKVFSKVQWTSTEKKTKNKKMRNSMQSNAMQLFHWLGFLIVWFSFLCCESKFCLRGRWIPIGSSEYICKE